MSHTKDGLVRTISIVLLVVGVLIGVAFFTLLERKILGYIQERRGPNKSGIMGLFQPFSDAIKLFTKENTTPSLANYLISILLLLKIQIV